MLAPLVAPYLSLAVYGQFPSAGLHLGLVLGVIVSSFQARRALEGKGIGGAFGSLWARIKRYVTCVCYALLLAARNAAVNALLLDPQIY